MTDAPGPANQPPLPGAYVPGPKKESMLSRRTFIKRTMQLAVAGALIPGTLAQLLPAVAPAALSGTKAGPLIKRDPITNAKSAVTVDHPDLQGDPPKILVGEWSFLPAVVYKVKKSIVQAAADARGYNTAQYAMQHPTEEDNLILVYRGKCKHLGCTVGWESKLGGSKDIPDYNKDGVPDGRILCPCHQGQYDIYDLAKNVPGTPPPEPQDVIRARIGDFPGDQDAKIPAAAGAIIGHVFVTQAKYRDADLDAKAGNTKFKIGSQAAVEGSA